MGDGFQEVVYQTCLSIEMIKHGLVFSPEHEIQTICNLNIIYTTKNKVPLDFVSTHLYPQDEQVEFPDIAAIKL